MPVYSYAGLSPDGKNVAGIIDADSPRAARLKLRRSGVFPTSLVETQGETTQRTARSISRLFERVSPQELAVVTRQLSDEHLLYMLFVVPQRDASNYSSVLNAMVNSMRINPDQPH